MAGPWPPITPNIPTGNVDNDADSLTLARIDIKNLIDRFNLVLASINEGDTPLTDNNSGGLMPKVVPFTDGQVPVLAGGDGSLARSGYPISTSSSLVNDRLTRSQDVKAYIAGLSTGGLSVLAVTGNYVIFEAPGTSTVGLMVQWGVSNNGVSTTFNPVFSTTPYNVQLTVAGGSFGSETITANTVSTVGITINDSGAYTEYYWLAIGNVAIPWE